MSETLKAKLRYASTAPSSEQIEKIKKILEKKFESADIEIETEEDSSIGGGFIVSCRNFEYDWSDAGRARQLRAELNNLSRKSGDHDTGRIISIVTRSRCQPITPNSVARFSTKKL